MKIYTVHKKQNLPISVEKAWEFLSNPANLKTITPAYMSFDILSGADRPMYPGQIIQYSVTPLLGIKTKWVTEITQVKDQPTNIFSMHNYFFVSSLQPDILLLPALLLSSSYRLSLVPSLALALARSLCGSIHGCDCARTTIGTPRTVSFRFKHT